MLSSRSPVTVRFDRFELDLAREELLFDGVATAIQPQPLKALIMLVTHAGKLVTREQMQEQLWPDDSSTDVERSLNHTIRKLRQVLRDDARHPRLVQTVPRRGYRFIGPLEESRTDLSMTIAKVPALPPNLTTGESAVRLRILDFNEVADDRGWPQIAEGVVQELTTRLVGLRSSGLAVIVASFRAEVADGETPFFGLSGCVRRDGAKVRVNAHLAEHPEGSIVATTAFEHELGSVFDLQGLASQRIVEDLVLPLLRAARPTSGLPES